MLQGCIKIQAFGLLVCGSWHRPEFWANRALHVVATERMSRDERTRVYVARRTEEGKSKREIIRCLKRYIARELYRVLVSMAIPRPSFSSP